MNIPASSSVSPVNAPYRATPSPPKQPNILIVLVDDLGEFYLAIDSILVERTGNNYYKQSYCI